MGMADHQQSPGCREFGERTTKTNGLGQRSRCAQNQATKTQARPRTQPSNDNPSSTRRGARSICNVGRSCNSLDEGCGFSMDA